MVLGEWQRSGYRRRVFFSSQTHCGTARQLEWKHRSSQLQSTGLFWGGRGAEDFLSKYRHSASLRRLGIIFIGAKRLKRVEPRKKMNSESNNLELRSVLYADRKFRETSPDRDFWGLLMPLSAWKGRCSQDWSMIKTWIPVSVPS